MNKEVLFPEMYECPEKNTVTVGGVLWILAIALCPLVMVFFASGDLRTQTWWELGCHGVSFLAVVIVFFGFLKDSLVEALGRRKKFFGMVMISSVVMLLVTMVINLICTIFGAPNWVFPYGALEVLGAGAMVAGNPWMALVYYVILAPVTNACIYYAVHFAPECCKGRPHPYWKMVAILAVPRLFMYLLLRDLGGQLLLFAIQLPIRMVACWSYQKSDTIWVPILSHSLLNLLGWVLWLPI